MNSCKVSILITFFNQIDCVNRAIESVLNQVVDFPFEIVIGDDGSTDGSWELVQEWSRRYPDIIRSYRMSRDDGIVDSIARVSRNRLFITRQSHGEYIVYLDGDDYFIDNQKLAIQVNQLESLHDCNSCAHNFAYVDEAGNCLSTAYPEKSDAITVSFDRYWAAGYLHVSCFMFRKPSLTLLNEADMANYDDNMIVYLLSQNSSIRYCGKVMFAYVQQENSSWNRMDTITKILVNYRDYIFEKQLRPTNQKASIIRHSFEFIVLALQSRKELQSHSVEAYGLTLTDDAAFSKMWARLTSNNFFERLWCRVSLLTEYTIPACKKLVWSLRLFK